MLTYYKVHLLKSYIQYVPDASCNWGKYREHMETPIASEYCGVEFEAVCLWMWICICHPKYCCYMFGLSISTMPLSISQFHIY